MPPPFTPSRRSILKALGTAAVSLAAQSAFANHHAAADAPPFRITLLGTAGGPPPHVGRSQPACLLEIAEKAYLIDAGENVAQQLVRAGCPSPRLSATFLTHLHWDHVLGLDYLMASGWMMGRRAPLPIWGPPGTTEYVNRTVRQIQLGEDIFRAQATDRPPLAQLYPASQTDKTAPHVIYEDGTVTVRAVENSHFSLIRAEPHSYGADRALSYRFDTPQGSVVVTGDTGPSAALEEFARGADVLVAEVTDLPSMRAALQATGTIGATLETLMQHMEHQHLTPEAVGRMAKAAGVSKLVLTHFVVGRSFDPDTFAAQIRPYFGGEIIVGKDLAKISVR